MNDQPLSPWETIIQFLESMSLSEFLWVLIGIIGVFIFYSIAVRSGRRRDEATWKSVMFWLIAAAGWAFIMYMVAWRKISEGGTTAIAVLSISCLLVLITTTMLTKKTRLWQQIVSGLIIAIVGYGIFAAFGTNYQPIGFAIVMGFLLGLICGQIISTVKEMYEKLINPVHEYREQEAEERERKKKNREPLWKKVKEI